MPDFIWDIVKSALWWILPMGFGGIALAAAALFLPSAALVLESIIRFLTTRVGQIGLVVVLAIAGSWTLFNAGGNYAERECNARWQKKWAAAVAKGEADKKELEQRWDAQNRLTAGMLQDQLSKTEAELKEKTDALANSISGSCRLGDDNARRLHELVGDKVAPGKPASPGPKSLPWSRQKSPVPAVGR